MWIFEAYSAPYVMTLLPQVLDEFHQKYKFMEKNLMARRRKLKSQVPDIHTSLAMLKKLKAKNDEGEDTETQFLLSDQVYAKATIPPTEKVDMYTAVYTEFIEITLLTLSKVNAVLFIRDFIVLFKGNFYIQRYWHHSYQYTKNMNDIALN